MGYSALWTTTTAGDKYQRGTIKTRFGTEDECFAHDRRAMYASGAESHSRQVVLNHMDGAGSSNGAGWTRLPHQASANYNADGKTWGIKTSAGDQAVRAPALRTKRQNRLYLASRACLAQKLGKFLSSARFQQPSPIRMILATIGPRRSGYQLARVMPIGTKALMRFTILLKASNFICGRRRSVAWAVWLKKQSGFDVTYCLRCRRNTSDVGFTDCQF